MSQFAVATSPTSPLKSHGRTVNLGVVTPISASGIPKSRTQSNGYLSTNSVTFAEELSSADDSAESSNSTSVETSRATTAHTSRNVSTVASPTSDSEVPLTFPIADDSMTVSIQPFADESRNSRPNTRGSPMPSPHGSASLSVSGESAHLNPHPPKSSPPKQQRTRKTTTDPSNSPSHASSVASSPQSSQATPRPSFLASVQAAEIAKPGGIMRESEIPTLQSFRGDISPKDRITGSFFAQTRAARPFSASKATADSAPATFVPHTVSTTRIDYTSADKANVKEIVEQKYIRDPAEEHMPDKDKRLGYEVAFKENKEAAKEHLTDPNVTGENGASVSATPNEWVPYDQQGDSSLYNSQVMVVRDSLQYHPRIAKWISRYWHSFAHQYHVGYMAYREYEAMHLRMSKALFQVWNRKNAIQLCKLDWRRDTRALPGVAVAVTGNAAKSAAAGSLMSYQHFTRSLFELVDLWTTTVDVEEYVDFLAILYARITVITDGDIAPTTTTPGLQSRHHGPDGVSHADPNHKHNLTAEERRRQQRYDSDRISISMSSDSLPKVAHDLLDGPVPEHVTLPSQRSQSEEVEEESSLSADQQWAGFGFMTSFRTNVDEIRERKRARAEALAFEEAHGYQPGATGPSGQLIHYLDDDEDGGRMLADGTFDSGTTRFLPVIDHLRVADEEAERLMNDPNDSLNKRFPAPFPGRTQRVGDGSMTADEQVAGFGIASTRASNIELPPSEEDMALKKALRTAKKEEESEEEKQREKITAANTEAELKEREEKERKEKEAKAEADFTAAQRKRALKIMLEQEPKSRRQSISGDDALPQAWSDAEVEEDDEPAELPRKKKKKEVVDATVVNTARGRGSSFAGTRLKVNSSGIISTKPVKISEALVEARARKNKISSSVVAAKSEQTLAEKQEEMKRQLIDKAIARRRQARVERALVAAQKRLDELQRQEALRLKNAQEKQDRELDFFRQLDESIAKTDPSYVAPALPLGAGDKSGSRGSEFELGVIDPADLLKMSPAEREAYEEERKKAAAPGYRTRASTILPRAHDDDVEMPDARDLDRARAEKSNVEEKRRVARQDQANKIASQVAADDLAAELEELLGNKTGRPAPLDSIEPIPLGDLAPLNLDGAYDEYTPELQAQLQAEIAKLTLLDAKLKRTFGAAGGGDLDPSNSWRPWEQQVANEKKGLTLTAEQQQQANNQLLEESKRLKFLRRKVRLAKKSGMENRAEMRELSELEKKLEGHINKSGDILELSFLSLAMKSIADTKENDRSGKYTGFKAAGIRSQTHILNKGDVAQMARAEGDSKFWRIRKKMAKRRVLKYSALAILEDDEEGAKDENVIAMKLNTPMAASLNVNSNPATAWLGQKSSVKSYKKSAIQKALENAHTVRNLGDGTEAKKSWAEIRAEELELEQQERNARMAQMNRATHFSRREKQLTEQELVAKAAAEEAAAAVTATQPPPREGNGELSSDSFDSRSNSESDYYSPSSEEENAPRSGDEYDSIGVLIKRGPTPDWVKRKRERKRQKELAASRAAAAAEAAKADSDFDVDSAEDNDTDFENFSAERLAERKARLLKFLQEAEEERLITGTVSEETRVIRKQTLKELKDVKQQMALKRVEIPSDSAEELEEELEAEMRMHEPSGSGDDALARMDADAALNGEDAETVALRRDQILAQRKEIMAKRRARKKAEAKAGSTSPLSPNLRTLLRNRSKRQASIDPSVLMSSESEVELGVDNSFPQIVISPLSPESQRRFIAQGGRAASRSDGTTAGGDIVSNGVTTDTEHISLSETREQRKLRKRMKRMKRKRRSQEAGEKLDSKEEKDGGDALGDRLQELKVGGQSESSTDASASDLERDSDSSARGTAGATDEEHDATGTFPDAIAGDAMEMQAKFEGSVSVADQMVMRATATSHQRSGKFSTEPKVPSRSPSQLRMERDARKTRRLQRRAEHELQKKARAQVERIKSSVKNAGKRFFDQHIKGISGDAHADIIVEDEEGEEEDRNEQYEMTYSTRRKHSFVKVHDTFELMAAPVVDPSEEAEREKQISGQKSKLIASELVSNPIPVSELLQALQDELALQQEMEAADEAERERARIEAAEQSRLAAEARKAQSELDHQSATQMIHSIKTRVYEDDHVSGRHQRQKQRLLSLAPNPLSHIYSRLHSTPGAAPLVRESEGTTDTVVLDVSSLSRPAALRLQMSRADLLPTIAPLPLGEATLNPVGISTDALPASAASDATRAIQRFWKRYKKFSRIKHKEEDRSKQLHEQAVRDRSPTRERSPIRSRSSSPLRAPFVDPADLLPTKSMAELQRAKSRKPYSRRTMPAGATELEKLLRAELSYLSSLDDGTENANLSIGLDERDFASHVNDLQQEERLRSLHQSHSARQFNSKSKHAPFRDTQMNVLPVNAPIVAAVPTPVFGIGPLHTRSAQHLSEISSAAASDVSTARPFYQHASRSTKVLHMSNLPHATMILESKEMDTVSDPLITEVRRVGDSGFSVPVPLLAKERYANEITSPTSAQSIGRHLGGGFSGEIPAPPAILLHSLGQEQPLNGAVILTPDSPRRVVLIPPNVPSVLPTAQMSAEDVGLMHGPADGSPRHSPRAIHTGQLFRPNQQQNSMMPQQQQTVQQLMQQQLQHYHHQQHQLSINAVNEVQLSVESPRAVPAASPKALSARSILPVTSRPTVSYPLSRALVQSNSPAERAALLAHQARLLKAARSLARAQRLPQPPVKMSDSELEWSKEMGLKQALAQVTQLHAAGPIGFSSRAPRAIEFQRLAASTLPRATSSVSSRFMRSSRRKTAFADPLPRSPAVPAASAEPSLGLVAFGV